LGDGLSGELITIAEKYKNMEEEKKKELIKKLEWYKERWKRNFLDLFYHFEKEKVKMKLKTDKFEISSGDYGHPGYFFQLEITDRDTSPPYRIRIYKEKPFLSKPFLRVEIEEYPFHGVWKDLDFYVKLLAKDIMECSIDKLSKIESRFAAMLTLSNRLREHLSEKIDKEVRVDFEPISYLRFGIDEVNRELHTMLGRRDYNLGKLLQKLDSLLSRDEVFKIRRGLEARVEKIYYHLDNIEEKIKFTEYVERAGLDASFLKRNVKEEIREEIVKLTETAIQLDGD
jgi:hypothetical protein